MAELLLYALLGGVACAIVSALLAPLYRNDPREVAVVGFFAGVLLVGPFWLVLTELGWS